MPEEINAHRRHLRAVRRHVGPSRPVRPPRRRLLIRSLLAAAILTGGYGLWSHFLAPRESMVTITHGTLEATVGTDALVTRKERVYQAPFEGVVHRLVEGGQRVRVGTPVVQIDRGDSQVANTSSVTASPANQEAIQREVDKLSVEIYAAAVKLSEAKGKGNGDLINGLQKELDDLAVRQWQAAQTLGRSESPAPRPSVPLAAGTEIIVDAAGMLAYEVDGLESILDPAEGGQWNPSWFRSLAAPAPKLTGQGGVTSGAPLFKVVDTITVGLLSVVSVDSVAHFPQDGRIQVRMPGLEGKTVNARVARMERAGNEVLIYLTAPVFPAELNTVRRVRTNLVLGSFTGKMAPRTALDMQDGIQGVWVEDGRTTLHFVPVRVLGENETHVVMETNLALGARIAETGPGHTQPGTPNAR